MKRVIVFAILVVAILIIFYPRPCYRTGISIFENGSVNGVSKNVDCDCFGLKKETTSQNISNYTISSGVCYGIKTGSYDFS